MPEAETGERTDGAERPAAVARVADFLAGRGYAWRDIPEATPVPVPETAGVLVLLARGREESRVLDVHLVMPSRIQDPAAPLPPLPRDAPAGSLQTDGLAFRPMPIQDGEGPDAHHRRLIVEQAEVVEAIRRL